MTLEADQRAHRHLELAQLVGAAEIGRSMMKQAASTCAPSWRRSLTAPSAVPPVAIRSSTG